MTTLARCDAAEDHSGRRGLHVVQDDPAIDLAATQRAVADLLRALGRDPSSPHLRETPRRMAATFAEMLTRRRSP